MYHFLYVSIQETATYRHNHFRANLSSVGLSECAALATYNTQLSYKLAELRFHRTPLRQKQVSTLRESPSPLSYCLRGMKASERARRMVALLTALTFFRG